MPTKKITPKLTPRSSRKAMRLHGSIARDLGVRIVSGRYKPGDILDNEIEASERFKVSRTAYREAVRILNAKGLVHSRPKVGTRVSPPAQWHLLDPDVLSWIFEFEPEDTLVAQLFELRKIVEPDAAALAAVRRTPEHLDTMKRALGEMDRYTLGEEAGRLADREFHSTLLRASGNAFLISLTSGIAAAVSWTTIFKQRQGPLVRDPLPDHERVYAAIAASDAKKAHRAMSELIDLAYDDTKIATKTRKARAR